MRPVLITRTGREGLATPAIEYVIGLGVPLEDINAIRVDAPVGDVQTVTVTLLVRTPRQGS